MGFNAEKCLKFVAEEDNCVISLGGYQYSKDEGNYWYSNSIIINKGEHAYVRGNSYPEGSQFGISKKAHIESGNIMSLVDDGAGEQTTINTEDAFYMLFYQCTNLTSVPSDFLPATQLAEGCYKYLFAQCKFLETAPELPATQLADSCYFAMFNACSSLETAPELPATQLADSCYKAMFNACSSLETAPELPATQLANECYKDMFGKCAALSEIKVHFTDWAASLDATTGWVNGVADQGKFYCPEELSIERGVNRIPENWKNNPSMYMKGSISFFGHSMPIS